jgi:hypothetical protein
MNRTISPSVARSFANTVFATLALAAPALGRADVIDHSKGFPDTTALIVNQQAVAGLSWSPTNNNALILTTAQDGPGGAWPYERESVFASTPVNVSQFKTAFDFTINGGGWMGDGITFCIQNQGPNALGGPGGGLAYGPDPTVGSGPHITNSVAIKFDIYQNWPDPSSSCTGLFTNGACPVGGVDLTPYQIYLYDGDPCHVVMSYDGKTLTVNITDTLTNANAVQTYAIDIPGTIGGPTAYVGFTGATGAAISNASILDWYYSSPALAAKVASVAVNTSSICGGLSTQGMVTLQQSMPNDTQVALCTNNASAAVPASVTVPAGQMSASFPVATQMTSSVQTVTLGAAVSGVSAKATLKVTPIGLDTMSVSANYVPAGASSTGTVNLQLPAAPGALTVQLTSSNPAVASVPASVTVPAGATSVVFPITTGAVLSNTPVLFTGSLNGTTRTTTLTVRPLRVSGVTTSVASLSGGGSLTATVTIEAPATAGGVVVTLSSNASCLAVPASVVVPAGSTSVNFPVTTTGVKATTNATITASSPVNNVYATVAVTR